MLSESKSDAPSRPAAYFAREHSPEVNTINKSTYLMWIKATIRRFQKCNFNSNNEIRSQLMKVIPDV